MLFTVASAQVDTGLPLALEQGEEIDAMLSPLREGLGNACLSEFAFSNLYLFRRAHAYRYLPGPWPCVAGVTYDGVRHLMPLFDINEAPVAVLQELLREHDCFFPVPASTAGTLDPSLFIVTQCEDDADYLYAAQNFRDYRGELLRKKRQLMQQLLRQWEITAHPLGPDRIGDADSLLGVWMQDKEKARGEADESACREALQLVGRFGFDARIYYADGDAAGFIIAQRFNAGTAVMRFAKGSDRYKGIYQYMFHHYCMQVQDIAWINFEQDIGLPNFRQTKRSYQPQAMLQKCRVALRA
ncbi:phosphatidylglycerol lysyltransferase domain-containing protein [Noviherbaspirillum sp. Root189]|uniref:phosphatidylglycerol lysyltransferase domain-containing protein n=1 Tax=Noviherbaspirillum sp. Root189 TaxID=1736487 RepID=UPI0007135E62|nr:phosphatidylglycerol lysyltransferase domain-containing protein [Noviherbaspirillum sp. Root189]KRB75161.1 hypothetical protein ASE07_26590 [Noviherbaspirillum sp. Root189]